jgi:hypothetical protein
MRRKWSRAVLACLSLALVAVGLQAGSPARADNTTNAGDNLRTGWDSAEAALAPSTITSTTFGQLFATQVQGQVYGQPLVVGSTVLVTTEDDYAYGLDAVTGAVKWQRSLGKPWPVSAIGCADLTPNLGTTSTGVYDPASGYFYFTTKVDDGPDVLHPNWYMHAVDPATGAERSGWPVKIVGTPTNDPAHPFSPYDVNQRPGLLLLDGVVYLGFAGQCDYGTYVGWVAGVNTSTRAINMWSDEVGASSSEAGIWQSGGGLVSDGSGRVFFATGNGVTPPDGPGSNPPQQLSESVVRLAVAADGTLSAKDFFSPSNAAQLDRSDQDLGSGGPVALPASFGTASHPHLLAEIGKDGRLFLLDRDHLGGKNQKTGGGDDVLQVLGPYKGVWGKPAVYGGEGGYLYVVQNSGEMLAFKYGVDGSGNPALSLAGNTSEDFGYTSGAPIVTSDGTTPGSGVVWVTNVDGPTGANGRLCAYDAVPANSHLNLLRCFPIGTAAKFTSAAAAGGRVYAGTRDGIVYGFGQPTTAALTTAQTAFGDVPVGQSKTATVTVTAARTVTVNAVATDQPFAVTSAPALPVTLTAGQQISVPVTFAPTAPGSFTGALRFSVTEAGLSYTLGAGLQGNAIRPGFTATPGTLAFGQIPVGSAKNLTVNFTNTGTTDETVTGVTAPTGAFTASGLPAVGTVLAPGQSVAASVAYAPTAVASDTSQIAVTGPDGTATVGLTGQGVAGHSELSITPSALNFGAVPVGQSATKTLTVENTGNLPVTVTKAAPPALPFVVGTPLPEGLVLNPGDDVEVNVTFAPTAAGSFSNTYVISSDDGQGAHSIPVTGTAAGVAGGTPLPPLARGGWLFNGSAAMSGSDLVLNQAVAKQTGSAVWSTPLPSDGLKASFTAQIGGGTGADGMTFSLLSASGNTPKSIGALGGGLGFAGLPGVAVTLDTYANTAAEPSNNFLGISAGSADGALPTYLATTTNIPALRTGTHAVSVTVTGTTVTVSVDGAQRLAANVPGLSPSVLPAFTAGNGNQYDQHIARNIVVTSGDTTLPAPGTGWRFNGSATMNGPQTVLTPAATLLAGSVLYSTPVATDGLTASFTLTSTGGTGADGSSLMFLDPAKATPTSLGGTGAGVGFLGLEGVAVSFTTYKTNTVSIQTSTAGATTTTVVGSTGAVPDLRAAPRDVVVSIDKTTLTVSIDGVQVLQKSVPALKPTALVGFGGGTGTITDVHSVTDAQIVAGRHAATVPPTGWTLNGNAAMNGAAVRLTPATTYQVGTALYNTTVPTAHLEADFTIAMNGGTGADGMSFMLLDPAKSSPTSIGSAGGGLGFAGLTGVAVGFITHAQGSVTSNNFAAIETGTASGATLKTTSTAVPALRSGTHVVRVVVNGGNLVVTIDGAALFNTAVSGIPANAVVGFSAGSGSLTDIHTVSNVHLSY